MKESSDLISRLFQLGKILEEKYHPISTYSKIRENGVEDERRVVLLNPLMGESFPFSLRGTVDMQRVTSLVCTFPGEFDGFIIPCLCIFSILAIVRED